ncbi:activator-dependent family glycosyltransferase [Streptomyces sp. YIM 98790]|uniref:activator-dependent family glycosyltransferase n=1 Tax=Streptomyces sp. YIM 98790 TaxID=2689077 RepID=UPI00140E3F4A|nr:activator-dependent family glycosyltransferase [Streptomyces sp. YIM 98790]
MRILIAAWPSTTHVFPVVPLAWALRAAGHDLRVACYPSMAEAVAGAGLTAVVLGEGEQLPAKPPPADEAKLDRLAEALALDAYESRIWRFLRHRILPVMRKYFLETERAPGNRPMVDDLVSFARRWQPELVLWDGSFFGAPIAARSCGAAHARLQIAVDYWAWLRQLFRERAASRLPGAGDDPLTELMRPMARRFGFDADEEMLLGQWTVDPIPEPMRLPVGVRTVSVRPVPYNGNAAVPAWLQEPPVKPRVCLTAGLSGRERHIASGISIGELLGMVADMDIEVVATLNAGQLHPEEKLPDNVRVVEYLPLHLLLPTCSAVIHHGGPGTMGAAIAAGVPQLVTGMLTAWDSGASAPAARYVSERGAGLAVDGDQFSAGTMKHQLARLLAEPSFQAGARRLHDDMLAVPSPVDIVPVLERLTARHRG